MTKDECKKIVNELVENKPHSYWNLIMMNDAYDEVRECIAQYTQKVSGPKYDFATRLYWFMNDIIDFPKCKNHNCGKSLEGKKVIGYKQGFPEYCCAHCANTSQEHYESIRKSVKAKYGVDNVFQADWCNEKRRDTMIAKYGAEFTQQVPELIEKCHETCRKHYGVDHQWASKEIQEKNRQTIIERYGTDNVFDVPEIKEKQRVTMRTKTYEDICKSTKVVPLFTLQEFINVKDLYNTVFKWKCIENDGEEHVFESTIDLNNRSRFHEFARCWICHPSAEPGISNEEIAVADFMTQYTNLKVVNNATENHKIIKGYEIDIIVPELKLGVEFDGVYFHSSDIECTENKNKQIFKTEECEKHGWNLIHIFEDEWLEKNDIVKSRLRAHLGSYDKKIYARKCEVKEITKAESDEFLIQNHLQGKSNSSVRFGLFFENELVSVMTFGKPRFNKKYEYELLRFASKLNYHVIGAASKLLSHFERTYKPKSLISYADRRWSSGNVYKSLGFEFISKSRPDYFYIKGQKRYHRMAFQKHKLPSLLDNFDPDKTEKENMLANGYRIIYDCGNLVFAKNYSNPS